VTAPQARAAGPPALDEDHHVHSVFSDGASTLAENLAAAAARGLRTVCLTDHVRASTDWLPAFTAAIAELQPPAGVRVLTGVEAKIVDMTGRLDLPAGLSGIDVVLIADHQFPADTGPVDPAELRQDLADGSVSRADAIECLVEATANAAATVEHGQLAHLFSVLPKIGLAEDDVPAELLGWLGQRLRAAGTSAEINEKWSCPAPRTVAALAAAGVPLVASTDSHDCRDIGVYTGVRETVGAVFGAAGTGTA
jgi:putative hydrolase